jgi:hypothetical protein
VSTSRRETLRSLTLTGSTGVSVIMQVQTSNSQEVSTLMITFSLVMNRVIKCMMSHSSKAAPLTAG